MSCGVGAAVKGRGLGSPDSGSNVNVSSGDCHKLVISRCERRACGIIDARLQVRPHRVYNWIELFAALFRAG